MARAGTAPRPPYECKTADGRQGYSNLVGPGLVPGRPVIVPGGRPLGMALVGAVERVGAGGRAPWHGRRGTSPRPTNVKRLAAGTIVIPWGWVLCPAAR